jgi:hypothetical protein
MARPRKTPETVSPKEPEKKIGDKFVDHGYIYEIIEIIDGRIISRRVGKE